MSGAAPLRAWLGFLAMVLGMFMAVLDIQIVTSSLGELQGGLAATAEEISWVQTSYLIAEIVMIPLTGFLVRLLSTRVLFVASCAGFAGASLLCAVAWNLESMIAARCLQGFLGGAMIPLVFSVPYRLFPRYQQEQSLIAIGLTATLAPTIGPALGGWITQSLSWHWIFLINLPPSLLVIGAVWRLIDVDRADRSALAGFDGPGLLLLAITLGSLQFALQQGPRWDWLEDPAIRLALLAAGGGGVLLVWREFRVRAPIVDLGAFRDRTFATGCALSFVFGVGLFAPVYASALFLAEVRGYDSLQIGSLMTVLGVFQFLSAPAAAALAKRVDLRLMLALGLGLYGVGLYLNTGLSADAGFWQFFWPQAVRGLALMLCFVPINTLALGTLAPERLANASGLYNLMRNLGGAIGIAVVDTMLQDRAALHLSRIAEAMPAGRPAAERVLSHLTERLSDGPLAETAPQAAQALLGRLAGREAVIMAYNDAFLVMATLFGVAVLLMPLVQRPRHDGPAPP